jgi:hypothetical protein
MATTARSGQLVGDIMATNNAINQKQPVPSWFIYLASTVYDVTGNGDSYIVSYDTSLYLNGGVTYAAPFVTIPTSGYYLINFGTLFSGVLSTHTTISNTIVCNTSGNILHIIIMGENGNKLKVGTDTSRSNNSIIYLAAGSTVSIKVDAINGPKVVDVIGSSAPNYVTWMSGNLLEK